ncbi:MAG: hypothetical protein ABIC18_02510 [Candidatus Omnitrophota bacterium]
MKGLKIFVMIMAVIVLLICVYCFLLGNSIFGGRFTNEEFAWYFLAKGIFCSLALYLLVRVLEAIQKNPGE